MKKFTVLAILTLASPFASAALFQYSYQGNQMSSDLDNFPDGIGALTIDFTVDQELDASQNIDDGAITPISWQINDGLTTITNETPGFFIVDFEFGTDSNGDINAWVIRIFSEPSTTPGLDRVFTSSNSSLPSTVDGVLYCIDNNGDGNCFSLGAANVVDNPGVWSSAVVVPAPPALVLFASALLFGFRTRK
jgi:hypothetical protein